MCFGGGGGSAKAQKREDARQSEQDEAIRRLNRMFGLYEETAKPRQEDFNTTIQTEGGEGGTIDTTVPDVEAYNEAVAQWQAQQGQYRNEADEAKAAREGLYEDTRRSVSDVFMDQLNEQGTQAERQSRFALARQGLTGGSASVDAGSRMRRERDAAVLRIGGRADAAATNLKQSDEVARLQLIDRIRGGLSADQAIQSAHISQQNAADTAKAESLANALGQVFSNYATYQNNQNYQEGYRQGTSSPYGTWNANPTAYSGRTG